jgi:hypothetical protein
MFNSCACMSLSWAGAEATWTSRNQSSRHPRWHHTGTCTIITCVFMSYSMAYIIADAFSPSIYDHVCIDKTAAATSSTSPYRRPQRRRDRSRARATVSSFYAIDSIPV